MYTEKRNHTLPIFMMILLFGMISFVTNLAAPMGVVAKGQFQVSNFMGMLGNFANFLAYLFMGIPAGKMLERIGYKKTALVAIAIGFVGILVQYYSGIAASFSVYLLGAFIAGFSVCILNTVVNPMLNTLGGGGKKGNQLIQIGGTFNSLMATITPMLVGMLIGEVTKNTAITDVNPVLFMAMGIFLVVGIVLSLVAIPEPNAGAAKSGVKHLHSPWHFRHFVLGAIAIFIYVGIEVGVPGTLFLFLTDTSTGAGISAAEAGVVVGTYWFLMLIGRTIGAALGHKISSRHMMVFVSLLALILVVSAIMVPANSSISMPIFSSDLTFGSSLVPMSAMLLVLVGLCTSVMWGSVFNLAVEGLGKYTAAASGIFMTMVVGGGVIPLAQNFLVDRIGFMNSYWLIAGLIVYLLYYALIGSKNVNKNIPVVD